MQQVMIWKGCAGGSCSSRHYTKFCIWPSAASRIVASAVNAGWRATGIALKLSRELVHGKPCSCNVLALGTLPEGYYSGLKQAHLLSKARRTATMPRVTQGMIWEGISIQMAPTCKAANAK